MTLRRGVIPLLAAALLAGCAENLARRDTISASAGDSSAQAIAAQAVNPWPSAAYDKTWTGDPRLWLLRRADPPLGGKGSAASQTSDRPQP